MRFRLSVLALLLGSAVGLPASVRWNGVLKQPMAWYASAEAGQVAESVLAYQCPEGGWPKNVDMTLPPSAEFLANSKFDHRAPTIDNGATITQLRFLALRQSAMPTPAVSAAFARGLDYVLTAQYPNGGWPQYFPPIEGYYTHITYNDDAMIGVLEILREVADGRPPYDFVTAERRARAAKAVGAGIDCILRTQIRERGQLTVWCAQHDETTLAPAWARNFEPPSLSGGESVGIVRFLMAIPQPTPEVIASVEGAVGWLRAHAIAGVRLERFPGTDGKPDARAVADPAASPLWARFYELETDRPIFVGRDRVIRYDFNEIERERRGGYSYLGSWPANLLEKEYPRWRKRVFPEK